MRGGSGVSEQQSHTKCESVMRFLRMTGLTDVDEDK